MNLQTQKINRLKKIYDLYHDAIALVDSVCKEKCSSCCTCNVTLTSLETGFILNVLTTREIKDLQGRMEQKFPEKRYIPKMTTNQFARLCREDKETPQEENDPAFGSCPLLEDDLCTIYQARPFGCRALISEIHCLQKGVASVPPLVLTLNTLFLQVIEHLDQKGYSGNLSDMLTLLISDEAIAGRLNYSGSKRDIRLFVQNEKVPILMVPLQHQKELKPLIEKLLNLI